MADGEGTGDLVIMEEDDDIITQTQTQVSTKGNSTLKMSRLEYFWVIIFQWDLDVVNPFQMYVKQVLKDAGFPNSWLEGGLNDNCRKMKLKLKLKSQEAEKYSLYCKLEKGNLK